MEKSIVWWRSLVMACIVLCIAFTVSASAGQAKPGAAYATIDMVKIQREYKSFKLFETDYRVQVTRAEQQLSRREVYRFLSEDDHKTVDGLLGKDPNALTKADEAKVKELLGKSQAKDAEMNALAQKPEKDLTNEDKKKLEEAQTTLGKLQETLAKLKEESQNRINEFRYTNEDKLNKEVREKVKAVADARGIGVVFLNTVAIYAGADITPLVLTELNK